MKKTHKKDVNNEWKNINKRQDLRQDKRKIKVPSTGEIFFAGSGVGFFSTVKMYGQVIKPYIYKGIFRISRKRKQIKRDQKEIIHLK